MENLRPHHIVCLSRLYSAILLFSTDKVLYYNCIRKELEKNGNLREDLLDSCKVTWGTIYNRKVMDILVKVIKDDVFTISENLCDSICSACYGNIDGKCVEDNRIQIMDTISINILKLQSKELTSISKIKHNEEFEKVCQLCGTKQKCNLIRRAVTKN